MARRMLEDVESRLHEVYGDLGAAGIYGPPLRWMDLSQEERDQWIQENVQPMYDSLVSTTVREKWQNRLPGYVNLTALSEIFEVTNTEVKKALLAGGATNTKNPNDPTWKAVKAKWCAPTNNFYRFERHWVWKAEVVKRMLNDYFADLDEAQPDPGPEEFPKLQLVRDA